MPYTAADLYLRDFINHTGDAGAFPLPVGDPSSGVFNPRKSDLRTAMNGVIADAESFVAAAEAAAAAAALYTPAYFVTLTALLADTTVWPVGTVVNTRAEGLACMVAAAGASDHHLTRLDGTKLYVLARALPAGTAVAPALYPTGDTNTGLFFPAADALAGATGGFERWRTDDNGNFGVAATPTNNTLGKTLQVGQAGALVAETGSNRWWLGSNWFYNAGDKYINDGFATLYSQQNGTHQWLAAPSGTADNMISFTLGMMLTSGGVLGVGTAFPETFGNSGKFTVQAASSPNGIVATFANAGSTGAAIQLFQNGVDTATIGMPAGAGGITFAPSGITERSRLTPPGDFLVAKTAVGAGTVGVEARAIGLLVATRSGGTVGLFNRLASDGTVIEIQQDTVTEGSISVSGTTVSYNGGHLSRWAQFPDNSRPELLKGTVMSNLDQMSNWDGEENEQLNCVQVSCMEGDHDVAGVFVDWDTKDDGYNDILLAMTGDMVIRIAKGVTIQRGDLLMSAGDGTAKPQDDDIIRSKTIAKVTSTHVSHEYADGSYAVPCVLMAC